MDNIRIGIIGVGSIGRRHIGCLRKLGVRDILALRSGQGSIGGNLPASLEVHETRDVGNFLSADLDGFVISNPTFLHISALRMTLSANAPVFIEKPIANSLHELGSIEPADRRRVMVGYCLRFHPIVRCIHDLIKSGKLGKIFKARLYCGQYLPLWHPGSDYRKEYYSKKSMGGGVIRTLSHEIDLAGYLFGGIEAVTGYTDRVSDLKVDVDDSAYMFCKTSCGAAVSIELDYLSPCLKRNGSIIGSNGSIEYSFDPVNVIYYGIDGEKEILRGISEESSSSTLNNTMYIDQMLNFFGFITGNEKPLCTFDDGKRVMQVIHAIESPDPTSLWQRITR